MCTKIRKQLKITLRSDLICGSGIGWGNVVDTDVVYDDLGFPYIPARRIRGLFKEALWELEQFGLEEIKSTKLFGDEENEGHSFNLYNAQLENIKELREEVLQLKLNSIDVLSYYTTIRYQTSIDNNGIAKDKSLRSVRAIKKGNVFYADLECEERDLEVLKKCCKMIKHMGTNRTRGFGEISVAIMDENNFKSFEIDKLEDNKEYLVKLCLRNLTQLSVTSTKGEKSLDYINGSSILGYFANRYLKNHIVDKRFYELFVEGNLKFHNAYITDEEYHDSFPAKASLFKEKTGDKYFDKLIYVASEQNDPVIMKKVRDKYLVNRDVLSSAKEMVYHHRRPSDKRIGHPVSNESIEDGGFYQLEVLSPYQNFISYIQGKGKDLKEILADCPSHIQIGKSKTTQYGNVELVKVEVNEYQPKVIKAGTEVMCTLLSPLVVLNKKLEADLTNATLLETCKIENNDTVVCHVGHSEVGGFNAKWRLQKPSYYAFSKGSCVRGVLTEDVFEYRYVGSMQQDGNGVLYYERINPKDNGCFTIERNKKEKQELTINCARGLYIFYLKNKFYNELLKKIQKVGKPDINNTTLNKMIMTLKQNTLKEVEDWIAEKIESNEEKVETKLINQLEKFIQLKEVINTIKIVCNEELKKSLLNDLLSNQEMEEYLEQLYVDMIQQYLLHYKRGDE